MPGQRSRFRVGLRLLVLWFFSLAYLSLGSGRDLWYADGGSFNVTAMRILSGEHPFRDFMLIYTPLHAYLHAAFFKFFGATLMAERMLQSMTVAGIATMVFFTLRSLVGWREGLAAWMIITVWFGQFSYYPGPVPLAMLCVTAAIHLLLTGDARPRMCMGAGVLIGVACFVRQDFGAYGLLSCLLWWLVSFLSGKGQRSSFFCFLAGTASAIVFAVMLLVALAAPAELIDSLWTYPVMRHHEAYGLPYPSFLTLVSRLGRQPQMIGPFLWEGCWRMFYYITPATIIFFGGYVVVTWRRRELWSLPAYRTGMLFALLGITSAQYLLNRPDAAHLSPVFIPTVVMLICLRAMTPSAAKGIVSTVLIGFMALLIASAVNIKWHSLDKEQSMRIEVPRAAGVWLPVSGLAQEGVLKNYKAALLYVYNHTNSDERIFVTSIRHDRFYVPDGVFYFLAERHPGTRHHMMYSGLVGTERVQRQIIRDLEESRVRVIVLREYLDAITQDSQRQSVAKGSTVLDEYLRSNFKAVADFGSEHVWERLPGNRPGGSKFTP